MSNDEIPNNKQKNLLERLDYIYERMGSGTLVHKAGMLRSILNNCVYNLKNKRCSPATKKRSLEIFTIYIKKAEDFLLKIGKA